MKIFNLKKVWRGFNGNIYFEPIHLQNIFSSSTNSLTTNLNDEQAIPIIRTNQPALPDIYENRPNLKLLNKVHSRPNSVNSKNVNEIFRDNNNNSNKNSTIKNKEQEGETAEIETEAAADSGRFYFSTYNKEEPAANELVNTDLATMTHSSLNAFLNARKNLFVKQTYPFNPFGNDKLDFQPPATDFILTTTNQSKKLGFNDSKQQQQPILPNLSAVKRNNIPLKGLAFREAKSRINYSAISLDNLGNEYDNHFNSKSETTAAASIAYYTYQNSKTLPEEYFRNFNLNTSTVINTNTFIRDAEMVSII